MGFVDDSTACLLCINQEIEGKELLAQRVLQGLKEILPPDEVDELLSVAEIPSLLLDEDVSMTILRFIVTKAKREDKLISDIIRRIEGSRSAAIILPSLFP